MWMKYVLITLINFEKYCSIARNWVLVLKEVIQVKFYFHEIFSKNQTQEERLNFLNM